MPPILMSAACAAHANAPAKSPMPMDATARVMSVLPRMIFFQLCGAWRGLVNGGPVSQPLGHLGQASKSTMSTAIFAPGGYRYIPAVFQYSGGVLAEPGREIVRVRFHRPAPLAQGFARIERVIAEAGRPVAAF